MPSLFCYSDHAFAFTQYPWNQNSLTSKKVSNDGMPVLTDRCNWKKSYL